jgi:DNA-binding beta-propeller fold protein YncE
MKTIKIVKEESWLAEAFNVANTADAQMYVPNWFTNTISQANLDGTGGVSLGNLGGTLNGTEGIALDLTAGKMYVVNFINSTISQANLDGTGGVSLGNLGGLLNNPVGIALDLTAGKMYVTIIAQLARRI